MADDVLAILKSASAGLLMPSESDFPLEPFVWKDASGDLDGPELLRRLGLLSDTPVESVDPDAFFANVVAERGWHGPREKEDVRRFRALVSTLKSRLSDLRVFRAGRVEIDVCIVGRAAGGGWAGLRTKLIET